MDGVVDFGGKGLARLPFGRRSAMLVTVVEAAPGFFFDRDGVVVVVDVAAVLLAVAFFLLLLLLSPSPLGSSSCLPPRVLCTEAFVSLLLDRKDAAEALSLLLLLLLVFGAAALSRTLLSIDDILGVLLLSIFGSLLRVYTVFGFVCFFVVVMFVGVAAAAAVVEVEVVEERSRCGVSVVLFFVITRVDCLVMDGDDEGRGEPLGDERGEEASRGDDAFTSSCPSS